MFRHLEMKHAGKNAKDNKKMLFWLHGSVLKHEQEEGSTM